MLLTREEHPEAVQRFKHIKPAPIFGPLRCFARCPGSHRTCTLAKDDDGPHIAHALFKRIAAVWDDDPSELDALALLKSTPGWMEQPVTILEALSTKLISADKAKSLVSVCEKSGIRRRIGCTIAGMEDEPEFALGTIAAALTSYANTVGERNQIAEAKRALDIALMLKPRHTPAWSSMALVCFYLQDYTAASSWADKVITFVPDLNSTDPWERACWVTNEEEMQDFLPDWKEAQEQVKEQMKALKTACARSTKDQRKQASSG